MPTKKNPLRGPAKIPKELLRQFAGGAYRGHFPSDKRSHQGNLAGTARHHGELGLGGA